MVELVDTLGLGSSSLTKRIRVQVPFLVKINLYVDFYNWLYTK